MVLKIQTLRNSRKPCQWLAYSMWVGQCHQVSVKVFIGKFHNIEKLFQNIKILSRPCLVSNALSLLVFVHVNVFLLYVL